MPVSISWCPWHRLPNGGNKVRNASWGQWGEHGFRDQRWMLVDGRTITAYLERWLLPVVTTLWCAWNYSRRPLRNKDLLKNWACSVRKVKHRGVLEGSTFHDLKELAIKGLKRIVVLLPLTTLIKRLNKALAVCFQKRVKEQHKKVN